MAATQDDWKTRAREARDAIASAPQGGREAALRARSGERDVNTLRRAIFAVTFLDDLTHKHPTEHGVLQDAPLSIIEIFARWNAFDEPATLDAVRAWATSRQSVRTLTEAMRMSRSKHGVVAARSLESGYRKRMVDVAERLVGDLVGGELTRPTIQYKDFNDPTVDYHFLSVTPERRVESVAVLIVGPYRNSGLYRRKRQEWLLKAFGLAWIHHHVLLLLPDSTELGDYERRVAATIRKAYRAGSADVSDGTGSARNVRVPNVHVACPLDPEDEAALLALAK